MHERTEMPAMSNARTFTSPFSYSRELKEISMFFAGKDQVHKTLRRLLKRLEHARIPYAIVGAMALGPHHYQRTTTDVDILLTAAGFADFQRLFVPKYYERTAGRKRHFLDRINRVALELLVTGLYPGSGLPGPVAYPDPANVSETIESHRVVQLPTLVELKLAARRHKDFGDVVALIGANGLDESFAENLHPSVRQDYIECLEEHRREAEYEARNG
jgi:hypothetical protein